MAKKTKSAARPRGRAAASAVSKPRPQATPRKPRAKSGTSKTTAVVADAVRGAPPAPTDVKVSAAKGRPMLVWVGKRPLGQLQAFPAQPVERFSLPQHQEVIDQATWDDWPSVYPKGGLLFHGDNKEVLAHLLANGFRGKVKLVYIDPPFDSGANYVRKVSLRGATGTTKIDGEVYTLGEQIQYADIWANDAYLQFVYERALLLRELLTADGVFVVHLSTDRVHYLKVVLDEVFGAVGFRNEFVWKRREAHSDTMGVANVHDVLLAYGASPATTLQRMYVPYDEDYIASHYTLTDDDGRRYQLGDLTAPGPRPGLTYEFKGVWPPPGRVWAVLPEKMAELDRQGRIVMTSEGRPRRKQYLDEMQGMPLHDVWTDVYAVNSQAHEATGYPTQKPESLLRRLLELATSPRDLVLDCFIGSGTTAAVAQKLGRRWIGCDINKGAIQTTVKRLQSIMDDQAVELGKGPRATQGSLLAEDEAPAEPGPAQLAFSTWRVNDYDLQIQHNEAVALACEHLGVQRTRTDRYFDGTLGKKLVKVVPFTHPLSPLDVEELKRELASRPDEDRDVTMVCLGLELGGRTAIDEWNQHRRGKGAVNRIEVVELRSDPKYGGFLAHTPASASVSVTRRAGRIVVDIEDFASPSIVERLRQQAGVLQPRIDDWRAMVDSVMVDTAYDGAVLNVVLADVPERKTDFVEGRYDLPAPEGPTTVAVRITDMLGEEVLVTTDV